MARKRHRRPDTDRVPADLVDDYFANWRYVRDDVPRTAEADARQRRVFAEIHDLIRSDPERVWPILLELVARAPDDEGLAFVAAGPLEELIQMHLSAFLDRLVEQTRRNPRFREAMQGVWGWERLPPEAAD
jgi:hypothetical protein